MADPPSLLEAAWVLPSSVVLVWANHHSNALEHSRFLGRCAQKIVTYVRSKHRLLMHDSDSSNMAHNYLCCFVSGGAIFDHLYSFEPC